MGIHSGLGIGVAKVVSKRQCLKNKNNERRKK
jgi:hypothetical protein